MARKPNYAFERNERNRAKAIKRAEKADLRRQRREGAPTDDAGLTATADDAPPTAPAADEA
jgi:hypothetical protein